MSGRREAQGHVSASQWELSVGRRIREDYSRALHWAQVFFLWKRREYWTKLDSLVFPVSHVLCQDRWRLLLWKWEETTGTKKLVTFSAMLAGDEEEVGKGGWDELQIALPLWWLVLRRKKRRMEERLMGRRMGWINWRLGKIFLNSQTRDQSKIWISLVIGGQMIKRHRLLVSSFQKSKNTCGEALDSNGLGPRE